MKIGQIHKNKLLVAPEVGAAGGGVESSNTPIRGY